MPADGSDEPPALPGSVGSRPWKRGRGEYEAALEDPNAPPDESAEGGDNETRRRDEQQSVRVKPPVERSETEPRSVCGQVLEVLLNEEEESRAAGDDRPETTDFSVIARCSRIGGPWLRCRRDRPERRPPSEGTFETTDAPEHPPRGRTEEDRNDGDEERPVSVCGERPWALPPPRQGAIDRIVGEEVGGGDEKQEPRQPAETDTSPIERDDHEASF